ncbi:hypothetical protein FRC07_000254 [Ceratobasidium sp. 392]|nr:hypothetical protein FRC07_000254 [Ceratobasidium sp. 392]
MSLKRSKRERFRGLLNDTSRAMRDVFRSRSPVPSSSDTHQQLEFHSSYSTPANSTSVGHEPPNHQWSNLNAAITPEILTLGHDQAHLMTPTRALTPELVATSTARASDVLVLERESTDPTPLPRVPAANNPQADHLPDVQAAGQHVTSQETPTNETSTKPAAAAPSSQTTRSPGASSGGLDIGATVSAALKTSFNMLRSVNIVPTLKSALDILADCIDVIPAEARNRKDYKELAMNIAATLEVLERHLSQMSPGQISESVANIIEELNQQAAYISEKQERTRESAYVYAEQDMEDIVEHYRRIEALFRRLQNALLGGLNPSRLARYDSIAASQLHRGGCTPNTRQRVLQELQDWASDPKGAKVYWMNGMAGTGKTTIAHSFCAYLDTAQQLAASFFCSRTLPECRYVARLVPTIAYQLARFCRPFQDVLSRVLESDPDIGVLDVNIQFERLLKGPLLETRDALPAGLFIVVVDALDECEDREVALSLLKVLLRYADDLPIKFFVTCRPERGLSDLVSSYGEPSRLLYHLHDIEQSLVQTDIETYLRTELGPTGVAVDHIKRITELSGKLFIYAATAVRYLQAEDAALDDQDRLEVILGANSSSNSEAYQSLDKLYTAILSAALEKHEQKQAHKQKIKLVLDTVVCAKEPLSIKDIADLLQFRNAGQVHQAVELLRSVLHVDEQSGLVSTLHASFPDYMLTHTRSGRFSCDQAEHNELLARRCFETMQKLLRFNICELESSYVLDKDLHDLPSRIKRSVPPYLFYACRYWSDHLAIADELTMLSNYLSGFLRLLVLSWVEVMNLKESTRAGTTMLSEIYRWMKVRMKE